MLRWIAHLLIGVGLVGWVFVMFGMDGDAGNQMIAIGILCVGVFMHHIWDELYRDKDA